MSIGGLVRTLLNLANPQFIADAERAVRLGETLALIPRSLRSVVTSNAIVLPNDGKAIRVISCFVVAATTGTGTYFTPTQTEAAPSTTQVGVSPTGDIVFASGDAVTLAEVVYEVCEGDVVTEVINVASSVGTLNGAKAAKKLISASVVTGVVVGPIASIDARATASPATGHAALQATGLTVNFNSDQVVGGTVSVTYIATPSVGSAQLSLTDRLASQVVGTPTV